MTTNDLTGRRVLITGGAQGLGAGMAGAVTAAGASVTIADIAKDTGEQTVAALTEQGATAHFVELDVTDDAAWEHAVAGTVEALGGLDVLVNNAGIEVTQLLVDTDPDEIRRMLEVNLLGTMLRIKHDSMAATRVRRSSDTVDPVLVLHRHIDVGAGVPSSEEGK